MAGPDAGWYEHPTSGLVQWWTGDAWTADVLDGPTEAAAICTRPFARPSRFCGHGATAGVGP